MYVIKLRDDVLESAKVLKANPDRDPALPCVYVGRTSRSPEARFQQHKRGEHASRHVQRHGCELMPKLYEHLNPLTPLESYRQERHLAWGLRRDGYTVLGGH